MAINGTLLPVEGFDGFFFKPIKAGLYMRIRHAAVAAVNREEDPMDPESASVLAAALMTGRDAEGNRIWNSMEELEQDERVHLVDAIGQGALNTVEEQPTEGN